MKTISKRDSFGKESLLESKITAVLPEAIRLPEVLAYENMIQALIFSKDRAMQLDAVLRSLFFHCEDADSMDVNVLYFATNILNAGQYEELIETYPKVHFVLEQNFKENLLSILNPYSISSIQDKLYKLFCKIGNIGFLPGPLQNRIGRLLFEKFLWFLMKILLPSPKEDQYILFLVDDNIFVNRFAFHTIVRLFKLQGNLLGFSLRLGENTTHCYMKNEPQKVPVFTVINGNLLKFSWFQAEQDFGYPLEISSSIYPLKNILPLLVSISFQSPNMLESKMAYHAKAMRHSYPFLSCYRRSVTFCNPINKVQEEISNRAGNIFCYSTGKLQKRFEKGERINIDSFDGFISNACHQEVDLTYVKRKRP